MRKIVFDTLNNDGGSESAIKAALKWANQNPDYQLILFGDQKTIQEMNVELPDNVIFNHSPHVVKMTENLRDVLRTPSSLLDAVEYTKNTPDVEALLSSGDSGAYVAIVTLKLKRLPGVSRPAFMPAVPKRKSGNFYLLDAGANVETKPEYLVQWAKLAAIYYESMYAQKPRVALLNIGSEDYKGPEIQRQANEILKSQKLDFNYTGFIEPTGVFDKADVVVSDGYAGNIMLKSLENAFLVFSGLFKNAIKSTTKSKIGGLLIKDSLKEIKHKFDYRNIGAAVVIGLDRIIAKAHGGSDEIAFIGALDEVKKVLESGVMNKMKTKMEDGKNGN